MVNPVDSNLWLQTGEYVFENFVIALSVFLPVTTSPPSKSEVDALNQLRFDFGAELRITDAIKPVFVIVISTPSIDPTNFFPFRVSPLAPATVNEPSACRITVSKVVDVTPTMVDVPKFPARLALITKPEVPFPVAVIPTIATPFLSTATDVTKTGEFCSALKRVGIEVPTSIFHKAIVLSEGLKISGIFTTLSGLSGDTEGVGFAVARGREVEPAIHMFPTSSTVPAVAIEAVAGSRNVFQSSCPCESIARANAFPVFVPKITIVSPETTIPEVSSEFAIFVRSFRGTTGIFFVAEKPAEVEIRENNKTSERIRFTLIPASDLERLASP